MRLAAFAASFLLAALALHAEDKAEIKVNEKKGLKFTRSTTIKATGDCKLGGGSGMTIGFPLELDAGCDRLDEVTEAGKDGLPTAVHRQYPKQNAHVSTGMFGESDKSGALEGADLQVKSAGSEGSGPAGKLSADDLKNETTWDPLTSALASGKAVTAGNTWDADKDKVKRWVESELPGFTADEAEMECKLGEFKDKDGQKCARIEVNAKVKGKFQGENVPAMSGTLTLKGDIYYSIDNGIAILAKLEGKLNGEMNVKTNGDENMKMDLNTVEWNTTVKVGEAAFGEKPKEKPKPVKPETYPPPLR